MTVWIFALLASLAAPHMVTNADPPGDCTAGVCTPAPGECPPGTVWYTEEDRCAPPRECRSCTQTVYVDVRRNVFRAVHRLA